MLVSVLASADNLNVSTKYPVVTNYSYVLGPYNMSFDLMGIGDLEPTIREAEAFQAEKSDGVRYELSLKDKITNESADIEIFRYRNPVAKYLLTSDYQNSGFFGQRVPMDSSLHVRICPQDSL